MAEKTKDIVAEKIERLEVRRNTSNQIISYTLPNDSAMKHGMVRLTGYRTSFLKTDFNRVIETTLTELVNPTQPAELEIVNSEKLNILFKEFTDKFSATYLIPISLAAKGNVYHTINFPNGIEDGDPTKNVYHGIAQNLKFTKIHLGPQQKTPGRYTITPELIESGRDLRMEWKLKLWNSRKVNIQNNSMLSRFRFGTDAGVQATVGLTSTLSNGADATGKSTGVDLQIHGEYIIRNSDMIAGDEWELQGSSGTDNGQSIYTGRSWWKIGVVASGTKVNAKLAASNKAEHIRMNRVIAADMAEAARLEAEFVAAEKLAAYNEYNRITAAARTVLTKPLRNSAGVLNKATLNILGGPVLGLLAKTKVGKNVVAKVNKAVKGAGKKIRKFFKRRR